MNTPASDSPTVSVLLPIYNAGEYLRQALDSTLAQSFTDFEVIAIDDGSTDQSARVAQSYTDPRIRFHQQANQGLAATLNRAAALARGRYLARQDQDDWSFPERFARQVAYLDAHPEVYLLGTAAEIWEEGRRTDRAHRHPTDPLRLAFEMLFDNYFVHSSVMMRRELFETVGPYCTQKARQPEDFELWSRTARRYPVANLPEVLHVYRETAGSMCRPGVYPYRDRVVRLSAENLADACGAPEPGPDHLTVAALIHGAPLAGGARLDPQPLEGILRSAAAGIAARFGADPARLREALDNRCHALRANAAARQPLTSGFRGVRRLRGLRGKVVRRLRALVRRGGSPKQA